MRSDGQHSFPAMVNRGERRDSLSAQERRKLIGLHRVADRDYFRPVPLDLPDQLFEVAPSRERNDAKSPGQSLYHRKALSAN
jgi:hypothetical protein